MLIATVMVRISLRKRLILNIGCDQSSTLLLGMQKNKFIISSRVTHPLRFSNHEEISVHRCFDSRVLDESVEM